MPSSTLSGAIGRQRVAEMRWKAKLLGSRGP